MAPGARRGPQGAENRPKAVAGSIILSSLRSAQLIRLASNWSKLEGCRSSRDCRLKPSAQAHVSARLRHFTSLGYSAVLKVKMKIKIRPTPDAAQKPRFLK